MYFTVPHPGVYTVTVTVAQVGLITTARLGFTKTAAITGGATLHRQVRRRKQHSRLHHHTLRHGGTRLGASGRNSGPRYVVGVRDRGLRAGLRESHCDACTDAPDHRDLRDAGRRARQLRRG